MSIWITLLETAIHSPSPHNVQPWRVRIIDDRNAELLIERARTLPKEDVTGSFIILTMGLFLEALKILAGRQGFGFRYELLQNADRFTPEILAKCIEPLIPFARLRLSDEGAENGHFDETLFLKRRTSRLHLDDRPIKTDAISTLSAIAASSNQSFAVITDREQIDRIMEMNTTALFEDLNSRDYHDEIVEWFRYSDKSSRRHLDGLDARCMNVVPFNMWLAARFPFLMVTPGVRHVLAMIYKRQYGAIPTLGVISGGFWKPDDALSAGAFLMRFWLETAANDLYIHPFGNLVTNRNAAAQMQAELGIENIWLVFKIGYSAVPQKSYRLPAERILVE